MKRFEVDGKNTEHAQFRLASGLGYKRMVTRRDRSPGTYPNSWKQFKAQEVFVEVGEEGEFWRVWGCSGCRSKGTREMRWRMISRHLEGWGPELGLVWEGGAGVAGAQEHGGRQFGLLEKSSSHQVELR